MLRRLETRLPPPVLLVLLGAAIWWAAQAGWVISPSFVLLRTVGVLLMVIGLVLNLAPKRGFRRVGTTVNPMRPQASSVLVTSGIYRYTRNPMYLGHVVLLLGWGGCWQTWVMLPAVALQMCWLTRLQIEPEERILRARFGATYEAYCASVRRWL